jgi:hypothetical protein
VSAGVLLHYHGGEAYALPTADPHVWSVAGVEVHVDLVATHPVHNEVIGVEAFNSLADATVHARRIADEAAEHERVALEMERAQTQTQAKRTGKAKGRGRR